MCCLFFSRNVKMNIKTKVYYIFLVHSLKRNGSKTFKYSSSDKPFLQCICYLYSLLQWMFFILCDNWKIPIFYKRLPLLWGLFQWPCCYVLWQKCFERGPCFMLSPQYSNSIMLIPKFKNLLSSFYFINYLK